MPFSSRLFGLPLHPLLVHFPVAFWFAAPALDLAALWFAVAPWWHFAIITTALGVGIGAVAIATGLLEYVELTQTGGAIRLAARHGVRTSIVWCLFSLKLLVAAFVAPSTAMIAAALALDLLACGLLAQGVLLGTTLTYGHLRRPRGKAPSKR